MRDGIPTYVHATDRLSLAGMAAELRSHPDLYLVAENEIGPDTVGIVAVRALDERSLADLRALSSSGCERIVLVVDELTGVSLLPAVECGVRAVARRHEVTSDLLARLVVTTAAGEGRVPPDALGTLLRQVARLQRNVLAPMGLSASGFSPREIEVLKLVAIGMDTNEIAEKLTYSERTIKNILHEITNRYQLKNRTHAVAFAMREGLI